MSSGKKALNVLGIIFAIILSFVLVISLIVSPIVLSSLSLLNPKNLSKVVTDIDISSIVTEGSETAEQAGMEAILTTNAAREFFELYATDITNTLSGKTTESKLTAEALKKIVEDNIDELTAVMMEIEGAPSDMSEQEIAEELKKAIDLQAGELINSLPKPQELVQEHVEENPEIQIAFDIIGRATRIKISIIVTLILLSALIFVCRLPGFKGIKWLSIDLFIASGIAILVCLAFVVGANAIEQLAQGEALLGSVIGRLSVSLTTGLIVRTAAILVFAIVLMIEYVVIKKAKAKKALAAQSVAAVQETAVEDVVNEEVPTAEENETV